MPKCVKFCQLTFEEWGRALSLEQDGPFLFITAGHIFRNLSSIISKSYQYDSAVTFTGLQHSVMGRTFAAPPDS